PSADPARSAARLSAMAAASISPVVRYRTMRDSSARRVKDRLGQPRNPVPGAAHRVVRCRTGTHFRESWVDRDLRRAERAWSGERWPARRAGSALGELERAASFGAAV